MCSVLLLEYPYYAIDSHFLCTYYVIYLFHLSQMALSQLLQEVRQLAEQHTLDELTQELNAISDEI